MRKTIFAVILAASTITLSTGCSGSRAEPTTAVTEAVKAEVTKAATEAVKTETTAAATKSMKTETTAAVTKSMKTETTATAMKPEEDNTVAEGAIADKQGEKGEGIGQTISLTDSEKEYVLGIDGKKWFELSEEEKSDMVSLMARWWDVEEGYVAPDYDGVKQDLDFQMETYSRNGVDESVMATACDIYGLNYNAYKK